MFHYPFFRSYSSTSSSNPSSSHHNQPQTASHPLEDVERASSKMSSSSNESTNSNSIEIDRRSLGEPYFQNVLLSNIQQGFFSILSRAFLCLFSKSPRYLSYSSAFLFASRPFASLALFDLLSSKILASVIIFSLALSSRYSYTGGFPNNLQ